MGCDSIVFELVFFYSLFTFHRMSSTIHRRLYSIGGHFPSKVFFHIRSFSIKGCLPFKVVFHPRLSSIKDNFPSKGVFHLRLSSIEVLSQTPPLTHTHMILECSLTIMLQIYIITRKQNFTRILKPKTKSTCHYFQYRHNERENCTLEVKRIIKTLIE